MFWFKEALAIVSMLAALASMLPFFLILCRYRFFIPLSQPLSGEAKMLPGKSRWIITLVTILVSGITFPLLIRFGNGFVIWLTFLMLVSLAMLIVWFRRGEGAQEGWRISDLGLGGRLEKHLGFAVPRNRLRRIIPRAVIMAFLLAGMVYVLVCISVLLFGLDLRSVQPFFRPFNAPGFSQFLVYLPFLAAFFTVNAGVKLYGLLRLPEFPYPALTQVVWWLYGVLVMLGGVIMIALIHYIPLFMGMGLGIDIIFAPFLGGPFIPVLIVLVLQFAVFFFISTWLFRKSGTVYTGSFVLAILAAWLLSDGSMVF